MYIIHVLDMVTLSVIHHFGTDGNTSTAVWIQLIEMNTNNSVFF